MAARSSPTLPSPAAARWQSLLEQLSRSSLTVRDFAAQHQVSVASLYQWRRRLASSLTPTAPRLVPVNLTTSTPCQLRLASGRTLVFDANLSTETLMRLVRALESA